MQMRFIAEDSHFFSPAGEIGSQTPAPGPAGGYGDLLLKDLTRLPRIGFKGRDARTWLEQRGCRLPAEPNLAAMQGEGALIAALSWEEHLVLSDPNALSTLCEDLEQSWELDEQRLCYPVPRRHSHAWFTAAGSRAPGLLAKLCGVDLAPGHFAEGGVAQTFVAGLPAIVIRHDHEVRPQFHLLVDSASSEFLWDCLVDAVREPDGSIPG